MEVYRTSISEPPAWRLNYRIGSGAFGTVFLEKVQTRGMESPELWAVKRIPRNLPNFSPKQSQAEIKTLQALSNPERFVEFRSCYEDTYYVYIAMEYIPTGDMSETFANGYRWNEGDTRVVIKQLLQGLVVMHKEGITHRNLKPENIFLSLPEVGTRSLHVKIGGFSISKHIPLSNDSTYLKTTVGTPGYTAPEMYDTSKPKTNTVDIWSLGCILYRMLAGSQLFNDPFEVLKYSLNASAQSLALENRGLSPTCVIFLHDVLQPTPEDRPSAEHCLKTGWAMSGDIGSGGCIGSDIYSRLSKIALAAPDINTFSDMAVHQGVDKTSIAESLGTYSKWLCLQTDSKNLTIHHLMGRTSE
ncbi:kinase-like domain-containing protein [Tuber borchii]|uniref:non-specific serine/threonine protein kinase n=1 Tax=Tuber borchii TaxID=42251 RepID=A0A2T6ZWX2_TUBBO|nr:kinase-like domain-containing protein [Tuber borchii]